MRLQNIISFSPSNGGPTLNSVDLPLTNTGLVLTVGAGTFTVNGTQYTLPDSFTYTFLTPPTVDVDLHGYIVFDKITNLPFIMVDDYFFDANDTDISYDFHEEDPYKLAFKIFQVKVKAGVTSLDNSSGFKYIIQSA